MIDQETNQQSLNKTTQLIKIEDNYEESSDSRTVHNDELIEELSNENSSDKD